MSKGFNKANISDKISWILESKEVKNRCCVFLSHKREDKPACRKIAEYFGNAEIDYYLDELDTELQSAAAVGNATQITESIKKGIRESIPHKIIFESKVVVNGNRK